MVVAKRYPGFQYMVLVNDTPVGGGHDLSDSVENEIPDVTGWDNIEGRRDYLGGGLSGQTGNFVAYFTGHNDAAFVAIRKAAKGTQAERAAGLKGVKFLRPDKSGWSADILIQTFEETGEFEGALVFNVSYVAQGNSITEISATGA